MAYLVYLASPYSHNNPAVREMRYEMARIVTSNLIQEGHAVFSPIVYGKPMEKVIGTDYLSWKNLNDTILAVCSSMIVLTLDGWEDSKGIAYELKFAKGRKIPVTYMPTPEVSR